MNTPSAFPAEAAQRAGAPATAAAGGGRILVWDAPVRVFHWLMVLSFAGAYLTADSERWRLVHVTLGTTMAGLVAFRVVWGFVGTRHARWRNFVRGPRAALRHLRSVASGQPDDHPGHNPAGALAIVAMLGLTVLVTAAGWATDSNLGAGWLEDVHEGAANAMLGLVGVHVAAVLSMSWLHRTNLVAAMITGRRPGLPQDAVRSAWRSVAVLMVVAALGFWWMQWKTAPQAGADRAVPHSTSHERDDD